MLPSLGVRRIYLRACPNDFRASPSMAGLPHHAGLVSGFCSSNPSLRPRLPSDSASRRTPLPSLAVPVITARRGLAPPKNTTCLAHQGDGDLLQQARRTMQRQLGQLVRLVDDLIDVNRINRDKIELRKERVELASIVHQAVEACQPLAEDANQQVTVTLPPDPIFIHADAVRLVQVFSNLLNNACKYSKRGDRIFVTAERQGSDVTVTVRDTGMGIPPDKLSTVFEMFTQVDRTLERSQGGLGIGLTLVKRLVGMHGGTVTARSEGAGRGSEFVVR